MKFVINRSTSNHFSDISSTADTDSLLYWVQIFRHDSASIRKQMQNRLRQNLRQDTKAVTVSNLFTYPQNLILSANVFVSYSSVEVQLCDISIYTIYHCKAIITAAPVRKRLAV